tara:strand:- start:148 stop:360 length:213 start_codon:yes stop_codon:yes gene_type:complete
MSWKDIIKNEDFDWDKEMKNIFDKLQELHRVMNRSMPISTRATQLKEDFDSITNSLHELEYWYESVKEKL